MKPLIGFAGLTHLGINSAAAVAAHGFSVICYDNDSELISRLRCNDIPIVEPGLNELFAEQASRLVFTSNVSDLRECDIVYIAADVPTDDDARSDLTTIIALVDAVTSVMKNDALLIVLCQVPPGFCRGLRQLPHNRIIYQVETLVFGRAVERAMRPERYIVGVADPDKQLPHAYKSLLAAFNCPILKMRFESAELAKISINFMLVASVCATNTLAELCEQIGADWAEIAPALRLDKRIGQNAYLSAGLGISGGNLERDLRTVIDLGQKKGTDVGIVKAWFTNSFHRKDWMWQRLRPLINEDPSAQIAVLGLAYKENTHSTKNSPSLALLKHLKGRKITVHDPSVPGSIVTFAKSADSALNCVKGANVLVIATPWPEYRNLDVNELAKLMSGRVIIDPYSILDRHAAVSAGFVHHNLGYSAAAC